MTARTLDWTQALFDVIDFRSFSSLWYWIVLAVTWSSTSHWVLGVPFDMIMRARKHGGHAMRDLEDLVRINVNRILFVARASGLWAAGIVTFALSALGTLAFWYDIEFTQAVFLLLLPLSLVGLMSLATAARLEAEAPLGDLLVKRLLRHRFWTQAIGVVAIFVTAMYGMYQNFAAVQGF